MTAIDLFAAPKWLTVQDKTHLKEMLTDQRQAENTSDVYLHLCRYEPREFEDKCKSQTIKFNDTSWHKKVSGDTIELFSN